MKQAYIEGFFPELKGKADHVGRGRGTNTKIAVGRAMADLLKQVKGKRITIVRANVHITEVPEEVKE